MPNPVLDYSTRPEPPRPSGLWWVLRLIVALLFGAWGLALVVAGVGELFTPAGSVLHFGGMTFLGIVFSAVAFAALRLPVHRRNRTATRATDRP